MKAKIFILISLILITLAFFSCSTSYKDQKAITRVLGKPALREQAYQGILKEHPCANDTVTTIIEGQPTIFPRPDPVIDSPALNAAINNAVKTLAIKYNVDKKLCDKQVNDAFDEGVNYAKSLYSKQKDTVQTKIVTNNIHDSRRENELESELSGANGQIKQLTMDVSTQHSRGNKWLYWFIGLCIAEVLRIVIKYWKKVAWL